MSFRPDADAGADARVGMGRLLLFGAITLSGLAFDLGAKSLAFARIGPPPAPPVEIIPRILELRTAQNMGALWGLGSGLPGSSLLFAGLSVVAAVIICYWLFFLGASSSRVLTIALALIMAGALGNCYDRLMFGHVRDFVHFHVDAINFNCAIFNFADNMLVAGALALVFHALRSDEPTPSVAQVTGSVSERPEPLMEPAVSQSH